MPNIGPIELVIAVAMWVFVFAIPVTLFFLVVRAAVRSVFGQERRLEADLGAQVVRERFARGEISREDAEAGMRALGRDLRGPA